MRSNNVNLGEETGVGEGRACKESADSLPLSIGFGSAVVAVRRSREPEAEGSSEVGLWIGAAGGTSAAT